MLVDIKEIIKIELNKLPKVKTHFPNILCQLIFPKVCKKNNKTTTYELYCVLKLYFSPIKEATGFPTNMQQLNGYPSNK